jgi:DNA (cytosine-5)-methyltransferase 1
MRYLSVCSGIEAATVAWHPLGWTPVAFSEIDPFPRAVLAHHYPTVPLHGDFTTIGADDYGSIDLLVGGTPCQDFSVAGLRAGITGDRGNLTLEFLRLAARTQPRWIVWENVPGVLSSDEGRALGAFLGGLAELGYGFAYRVLDAQYFNLAQRRARVFVVGCLGDWRRAAAVIFERESLLGHPAPRREAGEGVAPTISARTKGGGGLGTDFDCDGGLISHCLTAHSGRRDFESETFVTHALRAEGFDASEDGTGRGTPLVPVAFSIMPMNSGKDYKARETDIAQPIMAGGPVGGNQGGDYIVEPVPFDTTQITSAANYSKPKSGDPCHPLAAGAHPPAIAFSVKDHGADAGPISPTLRAGGHDKSHANGGVMPAIAFEWQRGATQNLAMHEDFSPALIKSQTPAVAFDLRGREGGAQFEGPHDTANIRAASGGSSRSYVAATAVRRLTPRECERLQGFPDDYTLVPYRGKPAADGNRYKALGNSMAVPVMRWIGQRIALVDKLQPLDQRTEAQPAAKRRRPAQANGAPSNAPLERETHGD